MGRASSARVRARPSAPSPSSCTEAGPSPTPPLVQRSVRSAVGTEHSLVVRSNGTVWAMGRNDSGQVGDGTQLPRNRPAQVVGLTDIRAVAAGYNHSLALRTDGTVWAGATGTRGSWGMEVSPSRPRQCRWWASTMSWPSPRASTSRWPCAPTAPSGPGATTSTASSVMEPPMPRSRRSRCRASSLSRWRWQLSLAAVRADGTAWAWGYNVYGAAPAMERIPPAAPRCSWPAWRMSESSPGGIPTASRSSRTAPSGGGATVGAGELGGVGSVTQPMQLRTSRTRRAVAAGGRHSVLRADGSAWGLGDSRYGQAGPVDFADFPR